MRVALSLLLVAASLMVAGLWLARSGGAEDPPSRADRVEELQQELDSLKEDIEDLKEPVAEFDLFDECMYLIGVTELGRGNGAGYLYGASRRPALALDNGRRREPQYNLLAFPGEEPPSIECNEDAGQEFIDE
jgi:hypothetical protein